MTTITAQAVGLAFPDVPGFRGQGWSTQETAMVVYWMLGNPGAWEQAMTTAREYPGNPHTVADTLHEKIVPRTELEAVAAAGGDPAKVNWLEVAHELIERRDDPRPVQEHAGITEQALGLAAGQAADPMAAAMLTAHLTDDCGQHLAHASARLDAARDTAGDPRDAHLGHAARHLDGAHACARQLTGHLRDHYPAEGAELDTLNGITALAKAVSEDAKTATLAHLVQTVGYHLGHATRHVQAMRDDPDPGVSAFNYDHARTHLDGAMEHAGKVEAHLEDNYPHEAGYLAGRGKGTAQFANRGYELNPRSGMISLDLPPGMISPVPGGVSDHHVTVVYLGPDVDDEAFARACQRAQAAAAQVPGPLAGTVGGIGTFPPSGGSDGKVPAWAGVVLPGAERLRSALEDLSASEHKDWKPHVTVAYVDPGDPLPPPVPSMPVSFSHLSVHRGDDEVARYPIGGDPGGDPGAAQMAGTVTGQAIGLAPQGTDRGMTITGQMTTGGAVTAQARGEPAGPKGSARPVPTGTITAQMAGGTITGHLALTGDGHGHHIPGTPFDWRHPWVPLTPVAAKAHFGGKIPGTWHQEAAGRAGALQEEAAQAAAKAEATVTDLAAKAHAIVPGLLGGGRADWNGKVALFDAKDRPAVAAYMGWDGTMGFQRELADQVAKGMGDGKVTDPVAAFMPHIDVLHELIHSVVPVGGETPEWKALPQGHKAALAAFTAMDRDNPSGGAYPTMHALADARRRDGSITQETVDDLASRGLLAKSSTTTSTYNPATGQSTPPVHLWTLTAKGSSTLPAPQQTHDMHKDAYRDPRNATIEEGFTELGTAHHAPEFLAAMGVGGRETAMVSVTSAGKPREKFDKADLAARKDEIVKLVTQANETTSASAELHLRTAAREMGKASPDVGLVIDQLSRAHFTAKDEALKAGIWEEMSALNLAPSTLSRATVTEYAKRLRDPDRIAAGDAWGHYGWQTAAAQQWVLDAAKAEGKGKKSPRVRALADEVNREDVAGKVPAMARQVIRAAGADPGKFQGAALAALETRIRYNWAQNPDEAKTSPWLMAMTAVRDYDSEH